jgi:hypothetical protein
MPPTESEDGMIFLWVILALAILAGVFYAGAKYGGKVWSAELVEERKLKALIIKERNELKANLDIAKTRVAAMGLEAKKIFPWLLLLLAVQLSACLQPVYAQIPTVGERVKMPFNLSVTTDPQSQPTSTALPDGTFYSPETNLEQLDTQVLASAHSSIALAAFSLTDQAIINALVERAAHGINELIYLDRGELQAECRGDVTCARSPIHVLIGTPNVEIRVKRSKVLMHLKGYAIDLFDGQGYYVYLTRDGSANFSEQGERLQDNSAIFTQDSKAGLAFSSKFRAMWARPDNLTVAQAVTEAKK